METRETVVTLIELPLQKAFWVITTVYILQHGKLHWEKRKESLSKHNRRRENNNEYKNKNLVLHESTRCFIGPMKGCSRALFWTPASGTPAAWGTSLAEFSGRNTADHPVAWKDGKVNCLVARHTWHFYCSPISLLYSSLVIPCPCFVSPSPFVLSFFYLLPTSSIHLLYPPLCIVCDTS